QKDLIADGLLTPAVLRKPTDETIKGLQQEAVRAAGAHHQFPDAADHKSSINGNGSGVVDWKKQATTPLFRPKRAKTLALLLGIKRNLQQAKLAKDSGASLKAALDVPKARHAIRQFVRLVNSERVCVDM